MPRLKRIAEPGDRYARTGDMADLDRYHMERRRQSDKRSKCSTYILYKSLSLLSSGRGDTARLTDVHRCRSTLNMYPIRTFLRSLSAWMAWSRVRFILAYACCPAPHVTFENRQRTYVPARESNWREYARDRACPVASLALD